MKRSLWSRYERSGRGLAGDDCWRDIAVVGIVVVAVDGEVEKRAGGGN